MNQITIIGGLVRDPEQDNPKRETGLYLHSWREPPKRPREKRFLPRQRLGRTWEQLREVPEQREKGMCCRTGKRQHLHHPERRNAGEYGRIR